MSEKGFLGRWSERKRATHAPEAPPEGAPEPEAAITAEELAKLPPVEDMRAETDLRQYLRKGVPEALKRAAMRRMWTLDPAIRDYLDPARDYAWDWNAPGGAPGSGGTVTAAAAAKLVGTLLDPPERRKPEAAERQAAPSEPAAQAEPPQRPGAPAAEATPGGPARRRHGGAAPRTIGRG